MKPSDSRLEINFFLNPHFNKICDNCITPHHIEEICPEPRERNLNLTTKQFLEPVTAARHGYKVFTAETGGNLTQGKGNLSDVCLGQGNSGTLGPQSEPLRDINGIIIDDKEFEKLDQSPDPALVTHDGIELIPQDLQELDAETLLETLKKSVDDNLHALPCLIFTICKNCLIFEGTHCIAGIES